MHAPEEYEAFKSAARRDIEEAMAELITLMKFNRKEEILDYGCGAGSTGYKFFKSLAEEYDSVIHAVDISPEMIEHAKSKFAHDRVTYIQGNILDGDFPLAKMSFDRIFSAYVFHYIKDYKGAMRRFFDVMKPGGQFGFTALARSAVFKMYSVIGEDPRFKSYMKGYNEFIPQWYEEKESAEHCEICLKKAAEEVGFNVIFSKVSYQKNLQARIRVTIELFMALNPFIKTIPEELLPELRGAYRKGLSKIYGVTEDTEIIPETSHEMVTMLVQKP